VPDCGASVRAGCCQCVRSSRVPLVWGLATRNAAAGASLVLAAGSLAPPLGTVWGVHLSRHRSLATRSRAAAIAVGACDDIRPVRHMPFDLIELGGQLGQPGFVEAEGPLRRSRVLGARAHTGITACEFDMNPEIPQKALVVHRVRDDQHSRRSDAIRVRGPCRRERHQGVGKLKPHVRHHTIGWLFHPAAFHQH
jgi:hypothetical protein